MIVFSVDPGLVNGVSWYDSVSDVFDSYEISDPIQYSQTCSAMARLADYVICERYLITEKSAKYSQQPEAIANTGILEAACNAAGTRLLMMPTSNKKFGSPAKLKAIGWWNPTKDGHANDSAAHLLAFCVKKKYLSRDLMDKLRTVLD